MIDGIRTVAHRVIGRVVMPNAPKCPYCGSPFLTIDRDAYNTAIEMRETCSTCGEEWQEGSADWTEVHPAVMQADATYLCHCCNEVYADCECVLIVDELAKPQRTICETHESEVKV